MLAFHFISWGRCTIKQPSNFSKLHPLLFPWVNKLHHYLTVSQMQSRSQNKWEIKISLWTVNYNGSKMKLYSFFLDIKLAWKYWKNHGRKVKGTLPYQNPKCIYPEWVADGLSSTNLVLSQLPYQSFVNNSNTVSRLIDMTLPWCSDVKCHLQHRTLMSFDRLHPPHRHIPGQLQM